MVRLNKEADSVTRELEVDVALDTLPEPLVMEEEAEVTIFTGRQQALAIPLTAIVKRREGNGVLVVDQGRLAFRPVVVGLNNGKKVAVLEGLKERDLVVAQPLNLQPGSRVKAIVNTPEGKGN